jgi:LacI family transcriptional regulator
VADHFLARGFKNFLFYSDTDNWSYEERGVGFLQAVKEAGHTAQWLRWHQSDDYVRWLMPKMESVSFRKDKKQWKGKRDWLVTELKKAPKPLAVFAANDDQALDVLESCVAAGLTIPEQVAIVGAENYLLAPDVMHTPISSVDTNLESLGYRGAELLDRLMNGKPPPQTPIRVPASGIVTRKSSDLMAVTHKGVAKSLRFIWEHCHEPICVKNLVDVAAMSRRGLHKAFLENLGRTPGEELQRVRIERAKRLLGETDHKMEVLAGMCGYQSANSFCVSFKNTTGMSPKAYRDSIIH